MGDLIFTEDFFRKEKRRSFTVGEPMKRSWAADLMILEDLKRVCDKHALKLFACYGTLLGAVRDHGFIAWDDDVDLGLVGKDYEIFLDVLTKEYGDKYNILNPYTRTWHHMNFTHVANARELNFKKEHLEKWRGCPFMAGPDIFPYYYIPRNPNDEKFILQMLAKIDHTLLLFQQSNEMAARKGELKGNDEIIQALTYNLYELQSATGYEFVNDRPLDNQLEILYDQICRITEESEADYVCRYDEYTANKAKKFPKEYFETTVPMPFENTTMPVPIGYDEVLVKRFGNEYIIPKREAAAHDYPFFKKQLSVDVAFEKGKLSDVCASADVTELKNRSGRKLVLYHTSINSMIVYSEYVIDKIKNVLEDMKGNPDIEVVWAPDIFATSDDMALDLIVPNLIKEYENLIKEYRANGGCVIGRENLSKDVINMFDEYYGDDDDIAKEFSNKKITIQEYTDVEIKSDKIADSAKEKNDIPEEWKTKLFASDGTRKKAVLYSLSVSKIYQNQNVAVRKIEESLNAFKENKDDMILLWRCPAFTSVWLKVFAAVVIGKIAKIIEDYKKEGWGILVDDDLIQNATDISDAFYGDPDAVTLKMKDLKKPVMLQNYDIV